MDANITTLIPAITGIAKVVIAIVFSCVIIPLAVKTLIPWVKERRVYDFVKKVVVAAEKLAEAGTISKEAKLDYVIAVLQKRGIEVDAAMRALIECAVAELDYELTHSMMSLVDAINNADDASEFFYTKGKVRTAEMDSRPDSDEELGNG